MANATVYIVDDDSMVRDSLEALLQQLEYQTRVFCTADDFLDEYDSTAAGCIIADVRMPGSDGLTLQQELVRRGSSVPLILITGHADAETATEALQAGAFAFIEKPFATDQLLDSIERALSQCEANQRER